MIVIIICQVTQYADLIELPEVIAVGPLDLEIPCLLTAKMYVCRIELLPEAGAMVSNMVNYSCAGKNKI